MTRYVVAAIAAVAAAWPLAQVAGAEPAAPIVPELIQVEDGHKVFLVGHAVGVQIYRCNVTATGFGWGPASTPRATLSDDSGKLVTTHFGGPTWQARDGSTVVGAVEQKVTVDPTAIPWLRLRAASTSAGADGDRLAGTTFIQRIATTGALILFGYGSAGFNPRQPPRPMGAGRDAPCGSGTFYKEASPGRSAGGCRA